MKLQLRSITFCDLVVQGKGVCSELIRTLLDMYIGDVHMTDTLTARLRETAPCLFSEDDATISKAHELISLS